jgi:eukaryotic-like serine/threonine-protein kinase
VEDFIARANAMMRPGSDMATQLRQQLAAYLQGYGERAAALAQLRLAEAEAQAAFQTHPIVSLPRRTALLEAEVLLAGRGSTAASRQAQALLAEMDAAPQLSGPRRAEALLTLGRVALAPGADAPELAQTISQRLQDPALDLSQALALRSRIALYQGRLKGDPAAFLQAAQARVRYFDSLPERQGVAEWAARLTLACALHHAAQPQQAALEAALKAAAAARPATLPSSAAEALHPLDGWHVTDSSTASACLWDF